VYHENGLNCGWLKFFIGVGNKAMNYFQPYLDRHDEDAKIDFENKRKLADVVIDEYPEPNPLPTRLHKKIKKRIGQLEKSIVTTKDGRYHSEDPKETLDSFAVNDGGITYPTILPSFYQSSAYFYLYIGYIKLNRIELITAVHFIRKPLSVSLYLTIYTIELEVYEVLYI
jgi:hypothetical protein